MVYSLLQPKGPAAFALLIDPDGYTERSLATVCSRAQGCGVDLVLVGGSLVRADVGACLATVRASCRLPIVLFPGNPQQLAPGADALLLLALISGRNPELLIGNHVQAAWAIRRSGMEVIPTGYLLIGSGAATSVQYISNTLPIPPAKPDIAVATALAGELLGLKAIYLEAGSGAAAPVPAALVAQVRGHIGIPLIVGGGLRTPQQVEQVVEAGASMVVVGNALEADTSELPQLVRACKGATAPFIRSAP